MSAPYEPFAQLRKAACDPAFKLFIYEPELIIESIWHLVPCANDPVHEHMHVRFFLDLHNLEDCLEQQNAFVRGREELTQKSREWLKLVEEGLANAKKLKLKYLVPQAGISTRHLRYDLAHATDYREVDFYQPEHVKMLLDAADEEVKQKGELAITTLTSLKEALHAEEFHAQNLNVRLSNRYRTALNLRSMHIRQFLDKIQMAVLFKGVQVLI